MLVIDGSQGEGGGQILRSALALAMLTGKAFRMENVRAQREKPGLLQQHLTALRAAAAICQAQVSGDELGSRTVVFTPGPVAPGDYEFKVGTAGSTMLVLQTVLPPLLVAGGASSLVLEGGTHNPFAPPFDFMAKTFLPQINRMGPKVHAELERHGFYPAGGGRVRVTVEPSARLTPLTLLETGRPRQRVARVVIAGLPKAIAEHEQAVLGRSLGWESDAIRIETAPTACGPGNLISVELGCDALTEVITSFGQKGVTSEVVAGRAVAEVRRYLAAKVPVGEHLADQLMVPLAMAGGGAYRTMPLTEHARTNREVIGRFLDVGIGVEKEGDRVVVRMGAGVGG